METDQLVTLLCDELRRSAAHYFRNEAPGGLPSPNEGKAKRHCVERGWGKSQEYPWHYEASHRMYFNANVVAASILG